MTDAPRKCFVMVEGQAAVLTMDTMEHNGELWLVPDWAIDPAKRTMQPTRMLRAAIFGLVDHPGRLAATTPIPRALMSGPPPSEGLYAGAVLLGLGIEVAVPNEWLD